MIDFYNNIKFETPASKGIESFSSVMNNKTIMEANIVNIELDSRKGF